MWNENSVSNHNQQVYPYNPPPPPSGFPKQHFPPPLSSANFHGVPPRLDGPPPGYSSLTPPFPPPSLPSAREMQFSTGQKNNFHSAIPHSFFVPHDPPPSVSFNSELSLPGSSHRLPFPQPSTNPQIFPSREAPQTSRTQPDPAGALKVRLRQMAQQGHSVLAQTKPARWTLTLPQFREQVRQAAEAVVAAAERVSTIRQEAAEMSEEVWREAVNEIQSLKVRCTTAVDEAVDSAVVNEVERKLRRTKKRRTRERKRKDAEQLAASKWAARVATITQEAELWREAKKEADMKTLAEVEEKNKTKRHLKELSRREKLAAEVTEKMEAMHLLRGIRRMEAESRGQLFSASVDEEFESEMTELRSLLDSVKEAQKKEREEFESKLKTRREGEKAEIESEEHVEHQLLKEALFGGNEKFDEGEVGDFLSQGRDTWEKFVQIRSSWDRFICAPELPGGTAVPAGWVLPDEPWSKEWQKYLRLDNQESNDTIQ